jgi:hypothetical protein
MHKVKDINICGFIFDLKEELLRCPVRLHNAPVYISSIGAQNARHLPEFIVN